MKILAQELEEAAPLDQRWDLGLSEYGAVLSDMDDIWSSLDRRPDKFELLDLPLGEYALDDAELQDILDWSLDRMDEVSEPNKIVHHDCMWAGTCSDRYHPGNAAHDADSAFPVALQPAQTPKPQQTQQPAKEPAVRSARSLLLPRAAPRPRTPPVTQQTTSISTPARPDTPQSLDEEDQEPETEAPYEYPRRTSPERMRSFNTIASDHSYTLCKSKQARMENLGVQTPSDSEEEEIDVETVNEKFALRGASALQCDPSVLDAHRLRRSVARQLYRPTQALGKRSPPPSARPSKHRKRQRQSKHSSPGHSPSKRRSPSSPNSDSDVDNVEKRSLHNDMERQRRIGLKNLFEELKREVPSIRDKERAPKVVVLREAALMCARLQREEREYEHLKARQQKLMARVRLLRMDLASRRPPRI